MKQRFPFFAPCPRGLEQALAEELTPLGAVQVVCTEGGVSFQADWLSLYQINLWSRIASRVLWKLADAPYKTEEDLYQLARRLDWPSLFKVSHTIKVNVTGIKSPLRSLEFAGLKIKDAICDRFRAACGERPSVDTSTPDMRIHAFLTDKHATIYLDTSGEALFKRGYRQGKGEAPLRENLAAGILKLTGWQPTEPLLDPMCGSGTFLIEAAMLALDIPPGGKRHFAFEKLSNFDATRWQNMRDAANAKRKEDDSLRIYGCDYIPSMIDHAATNAEAAGVDDVIRLRVADAREITAPTDHGVWICNPPYGIRLDEQEQLLALYPELGSVLKKSFNGWRAFFFTADPALAKAIRLSTSRRTPLFNGALECRLFEYRMVAGSNRKLKED